MAALKQTLLDITHSLKLARDAGECGRRCAGVDKVLTGVQNCSRGKLSTKFAKKVWL